MEPKKSKPDEKTDLFLQSIKTSRARALHLPRGYASRLDVVEAIANNRAITTLHLPGLAVRFNVPVVCVETSPQRG
jgi:hypothetical protein